MPTLVCVPIMLDDSDRALADAAEARSKGADLVEYRIDGLVGDDEDAGDPLVRTNLGRLLDETPLPTILTCRAAEEGGGFEGTDGARAELLEHLCARHRAPAYLDVEQAAFARSPELRAAVERCAGEQGARLILSIHGPEGRPESLERRLLWAAGEPSCAAVKVAYLARSVRDNLELFDLLGRSPKPMIALAMGRFGMMSRVLAPKFGGLVTFASLRQASTTAPGQPTIDELLGMYRFRSIGRETGVYGVIGWPVEHSKGPLVHNAGFGAIGWDGVYLPLPVAADENDPEGSYLSFRETFAALVEHPGVRLSGASVTIPHKENFSRYCVENGIQAVGTPGVGAANTFAYGGGEARYENTDAVAVGELLRENVGSLGGATVGVVGAGGVARAAAHACAGLGATVVIYNRTLERAQRLADEIGAATGGKVVAASADLLPRACCGAFINCTPVGMAGGPDPEGLSIPIPEMVRIGEDTVFFDTVYTPPETPMLRAARERGCRTVDGAAMFVRQAAAQFELWTGAGVPEGLFEGLVEAGKG